MQLTKRPRARIWAIMLGVIAGLPGSPAEARNLEQLAGLLTQPFFAQNVAAVCGARDRSFLWETRGPHGTMHAYAQHIKEEVIAGLEPSEYERILRTAANVARTSARAMLQDLADVSPSVEDARIDKWCDTFGKTLVRQVITEHDAAHDAFLQSVEQAGNE